MSLIHIFKKMKDRNLDNWLAPVLQIVQKIPENFCPCLYLQYQLAKFEDLMSCRSTDKFKIAPCLMY